MRKHLSIFILILFLLPGVFSLAKTSSSSDIRYLFAYFTDKNENRNGMLWPGVQMDIPGCR